MPDLKHIKLGDDIYLSKDNQHMEIVKLSPSQDFILQMILCRTQN